MTIKELTPDQIEQRVGTRHAGTGIEYPPSGLQPYYHWLMRTLHLLAESSAAALRVARDDADATTIRVLPGRASIGGVALAYAGGTVDLAAHNNDTAYVWLEDDGGATVKTAGAATGWPATAHIKLAEVTLAGGEITDVLDRRFETFLKA
jgi:hypothetical protein